MQLHYPLNPTTGKEDQTQLPWTDGVPQTSVEGSFPPSAMCVETMMELVNLLNWAGLTGTSADLNQVTRAIRGGQLDFDATETGTADAMAVQIGLPHTKIQAGLPFSFVKGPNANTGNAVPTLTITDLQGNNGLTGTIVKAGGGAILKGDLSGGALITVRAVAPNVFALVSLLTTSDVLALIQANTRTLLRANVTVYVRPDGSDANTGLADTPAGAFKTPTGAYNAVAQLYILSGFSVTIQLSQTYATQVLGSAQPVSYPGIYAKQVGLNGSILLLGDVNNPQNYVLAPITVGSSIFCAASEISTLTIQGVTFDGSTIPAATQTQMVKASTGGTLQVGQVIAKYTGTSSVLSVFEADPGGSIVQTGTITVTGGGTLNAVIQIQGGSWGGVGVPTTQTFAVTNLTFSYFYLVNSGRASLQLTGFTSSNASGARYNVVNNGVIDPAGVALTSIPGTTAGATGLGGQVNGDPGPAWTAYTPQVLASSGGFNGVSAAGRWSRSGKLVTAFITFSISSVGSASGVPTVSLPVPSMSTVIACGAETVATGKAVRAFGNPGQPLGVAYADNSSVIAAGTTFVLEVVYEAQN